MKNKDHLELKTSFKIEGQNFKSFNYIYYPAYDATIYNTFIDPDTNKKITGEWIKEYDKTLPKDKQEKRIFCLKGKLVFNFYGTNLSIRVELNPNWGEGKIYIDGQKPSQIVGAVSYTDTVSCDAYLHNSGGQEFKDILVIEGLENTNHTLEIYCNNTNNSATGGEWFVLNGFKVFNLTNNTIEKDAYIENKNVYQQSFDIILKNNSENNIFDINFDINYSWNQGNNSHTEHFSKDTLSSGAEETINLTLPIIGNEQEQLMVGNISTNYLIKDPAGDVLIGGVQTDLPVTSSEIRYTGSWVIDTDLGETRAFTNSLTSFCLIDIPTSSFTIRVEKDYGWGTLAIMKKHINVSFCKTTSGSSTIYVPDAYNKGVRVGQYVRGSGINKYLYVVSIDGNNVVLSGTASSTKTNVTLTFRTLHTTVSCASSTTRYYEDINITGLDSTGETIEIVPTTANYIIFSKISYITAERYARYYQNHTLNISLKALTPNTVNSFLSNKNKINFFRLPAGVNYQEGFSNNNLHGYSVEARFPTFCCVYKPNMLEKMKLYDIVITDPMAITYNEVKELQKLGIKVLLYVSFGEEDGERADEWDLQDRTLAPRKGDGLGIGGYASYYMKGGYNFGEVSECNHDLKRKGQNKCALNSSNYYNSDLVRCSAACLNDWRTGYSEWINGGSCSEGYTRDNYWIRNATQACSNQSCPKYSPINSKCPLYTPAENAWGQDFSMFESNYPDENGIWKSFYINAVDRGEGSWYNRIKTYYLPLIFNSPVKFIKTYKTGTHTTLSGVNVIGFKIEEAPIEESLGLSIKNGEYEYTKHVDYTFDDESGVFIIAPQGNAPACPAGTILTVEFWKKGLEADGVFMDTVDTVDVYNDPVYQKGLADLINDMKKFYPNKIFCSNRGFSILPSIIKSCEYVMFETFLSNYNWENGTYHKITNPDEVEYNNSISELLNDLRKTNKFDVLGLNYAHPNDTELKTYIREECLKRGYLCEISEILLDDIYYEEYDLDNSTPKPVTTNKFKEVIYEL